MKISLVILTYDGWEYTNQLLMDIKANCFGVHEIIVIDNGSKSQTLRMGLGLWSNELPLTIYRLDENIGFPAGMNYGISKATGDVIVLLSNDVRILSNYFIPEIEKQFTENKNILLGPSLYTQNTGWNMFGDITVPYVEGYCLIASSDFWNKYKFDTQFSPSDFEDVDLSMQAVIGGYELVELKKGLIIHMGGKTLGYNDIRFERTRTNKKKFAEKWSLKND